HPRYEVPRTYRVRLRRRPSDGELARLRHGVDLDDGPTAPARVREVSPRVIELTLREGRNRQTRRMASAIGTEVVALERIRLDRVPLMCGREMRVAGAMERVIRVLVHYYAAADHTPAHAYLGAARELRMDLDSAQ